MEWISKLVEAAIIPTKIILCVFIVASTLLVLPNNILNSLRVKDFIDKHGIYIGITALSSGALLVINFSIYLWGQIKIRGNKNKIINNSVKRIQSLDHAEKAVLREFFLQGQNTIKLPMDNPVVAGLLNSGILVIVGSQARMSLVGMLTNMKISENVNSLIIPEILDLPTHKPTPAEIEFIKNNRPSFVSSILRSESFFSS